MSWLVLLALAGVAPSSAFAGDYLKIPSNLFHLAPADDDKPAKKLAEMAPASGAPAIPDPDPLTITPLLPLNQGEVSAAPADAQGQPAVAQPAAAIVVDEVIKDEVPEALTPIPVKPIATIVDTPPVPASTPAQPAGAADKNQPKPSEPPAALSQESKQILATLPAENQKPRADSKMKLDIDRAKDTKYISEQNAPPAPDGQAPQTNAMGMSVKLKENAINFNYELEKAYSAIVAGHSEVAIEIYQRILSNDANNKDALFGLATCFHRAGQIDQARPLYAKLLALDPKDRDVTNNFLVLLADEAPQEALDQLAILEEKNPGLSVIPAQMAAIYQKLGVMDKASDKMFKATALAPENLTYRYNLAILLDKQEKYEEAAKLYRQLLEAAARGEVIPGSRQKIQERLTFISSNRL